MIKKLLGIVVLGLLWYSNSFSQNCDPNQYNDGMMVKEYEAEWNYKAEEAYSFGKKIQNDAFDTLFIKIESMIRPGTINEP